MSTPSSPPSTQRIESVAEFLVHALELEHESAERYRQLAETMTLHHNHTVAAVFRLLADMSAAHASEVTARAEGIRLPEIAPWAFKWACPGSPEVDCDDFDVTYLMTPLQAFELALYNEIRGRDFYAFVAADSPQPQVRVLAAEMAAEENEHVELVSAWVERERLAPTRMPEDLDPPNQQG